MNNRRLKICVLGSVNDFYTQVIVYFLKKNNINFFLILENKSSALISTKSNKKNSQIIFNKIIKSLYLGRYKALSKRSLFTFSEFFKEKIFNLTKKKKLVRPYILNITQDAKIVDSINSKNSLKYLKKMKFDLGLLAGVGILTKETLKTFKTFCLNAHPAPLPECRGGGALINSLAQNLVPAASVHIVREGIDAGEILKVAPLKLNKKDCFNSIESRLAIHCAEILSKVVKKIISGKKYKAKKNSGKLHQWKDCTIDKQRMALSNLKKLLKKV